MKKIFLFIGLMQLLHVAYAQDRLRVPLNMLLHLKVPIQPTDISWNNWNLIPNPKDSTQTIRIDRRVQGYAPFIPREDAPYYNSSQLKEIQVSLEKILNPDGYFKDQEEFMGYCREFLEKYVFQKTSEK